MATAPTVELSLPEMRPVRVDASDAALVIIDMQNEYMAPGETYYMPGMAERAVENLIGVMERFRGAGAPIIHVQSIRSPGAAEFSVYGQDEMLIEDGWRAEIFPPLLPLPGEEVVRKRSNDCFVHTRMPEVLAAHDLVPGRSQIVMTGCATHGCVACAVVGFSVRGYDVAAVEDCMAANTPDDQVLGFRLFTGPAYAHNVTPTTSALLELDVTARSASR